MSEIVKVVNNFQEREIINRIQFPKEQEKNQGTMNQTKRVQKSVATISDSADKKRRRKNDKDQKEQ